MGFKDIFRRKSEAEKRQDEEYEQVMRKYKEKQRGTGENSKLFTDKPWFKKMFGSAPPKAQYQPTEGEQAFGDFMESAEKGRGKIQQVPQERKPEAKWYPTGFWTPRVGGFKVNIQKFLFAMLVMAGSLVIPFIFKESGSAWFISMAISLWAIGTIFPSHLPEKEEGEGGNWGTGVLLMKASLNGTATIFLSLGLLAISPSTPFMRLLTLVVFTIAYLSFPTGGGDNKYKAYLASWRMFLGFYFIIFFILAFMNVLSVSPLIFLSLLLLAFAFYFNFPDLEIAETIGKSKPFMIVNKIAGGESTGGMMMFGIMMMLVGASMALFLGNMKFLFFSTYTWATIAYFAGIMMLLMGSASGSKGETVIFSFLAGIGLAIGAFDLWMEKHYFAAMGYNILVGMSVASGAASQQARPIIGVTALSFAIIILTSAYPAVLGEAVFGAWWPQVEGGVTTIVGPMTDVTGQMQESFQNAFLMFSCPSCYYEKQLEKQQANANMKSGGTAKSIDVSDFTFQVVNIPEQPLLATATLENKGEFSASNINVKLKSLQTKNKKGGLSDAGDVNYKFVTCSGTASAPPLTDSCSWSGNSYNGDMKQITFTYGYKDESKPDVNPWGSALGSCSCYTSDGKLKGYCLPATDGSDISGCKKCANFKRVDLETGGVGLGDLGSDTCDISGSTSGSRDYIGYVYGGYYAVVGFDYSFDYIVNVSLDTQLMQSNTLNDLLLKKQITLRDVKAEYSGGPVKASIWTQKQPVRAGEDTLAVISIENAGTGTVKIKEPQTCAEAGGVCEAWALTIGNCASTEKEINPPNNECGTGLSIAQPYCCIPESKYNSLSGKTADFTLTIPFISGIVPKIAEVSRGGLNCGDMSDKAIINEADYKGGTGRVEKSDSYELHCNLESNLEKGKLARYAFTFNYDIPENIDRKSAIFVGNVNYNYQSSYTKEAQIVWAPPQ
ncbi:MAG: hypothetical protein WA139_00370 [Candidatus Aenigmatarchaeota archaeon]